MIFHVPCSARAVLMSSIETLLIKLNWKAIDIRRRCQTTAYISEAVLMVRGLARPHSTLAVGKIVILLHPLHLFQQG